MTIDRNKNEVRIENIIEFYDGKTTKLSAEEAILDTDISRGVILGTNVLIDEIIKIQADQVDLKNQNIDQAINIKRITSCDICNNKKARWYFTASSAVRDLENSNIVYRNVTLRIKGFPVAYLYYLRLPDPSVERARGFLMPKFIVSSNLGTGVKLPYFIPVGDSRDLLLTPFISSNTKTLEYRYRQKYRNGAISVIGAYSNDELFQTDRRYYYKTTGNLELKYGVDVSINTGRVNKARYMEDYSYGTVADLNSEVTLSKNLIDRKNYLNGTLTYVRDSTGNNALAEYYVLSGNYTSLAEKDIFGGKLFRDASVNSSLNVLDKTEISRPPSSIHAGLRHLGNRIIGSTIVSNETFARINSFVNSENFNTTNEDLVLQYGTSLKINSPMFKENTSSKIILSPKILLSVNGQEGRTRGDNFIGSDRLTYGNIFAAKKYSSLSESELGLTLSAGFDYKLDWIDSGSLQLSLAASRTANSTYTPSENNGLQEEKFSFLGLFNYKNSKDFSLFGNALFSETGEFLEGDLKSEFKRNKILLNSRYEFISSKADNRLIEDLRNIEISNSYRVSNNIDFNSFGKYDLSEKSMTDSSFGIRLVSGHWTYKFSQKYFQEEANNSSLAAIFDDECTIVKITLKIVVPQLELTKI